MTTHHPDTDIHEATEPTDPETGTDQDAEATTVPADAVEVRRNGALAVGVAGVAGLVAVAYLARAASSGSLLDWVVFVALAGIAGVHVWSWRDSRTPLLVADRTGIRVRLGRSWQGLPWEEVEEVEHAPRRGLLRDGRLVAFPVDADGLVEGLDSTARRQALVTERVHGAPFAVPLGLTTTVVGAPDGLTAALLALVPDPDIVVEVVPGSDTDADTAVPAPETDADLPDRVGDLTDTAERPRLDPAAEDDTPTGELVAARETGPVDGGPDRVVDRVVDRVDDTVVRPRPVVASPTPEPVRAPVVARRAEVEESVDQTRLRPLPAPPTVGQLRRDAHDYFTSGPDDTGVWRSTTVVIDDLAGPAVEPVIGPQLTRAREALGLSVERLAERTRIRAHVIEAIEVDDFEPCGGDFYARGHLRTLARVLGVDAAPLVAAYDETWADAPIEARKVFEAELSTGSEGAIRSLRGGPNWSVLVAAVMAVVLAWSVVRLVMDQPTAADDTPSLAGDSAGLTSGQTSLSAPVPVALTAAGGGAKVVVRDGGGAVVFKGTLAFGQSKTLKASPPLRVQASDGSLTVAVDGADPRPMGRTGQSARATYVPDPD